MEIGIIGLGRMGGNMALRLMQGGHRVVGHARTPETVARYVQRGLIGAQSLKELAQALTPPRTIWMMVPAGAAIDEMITALIPELAKGDILIDGGNSNYRDTLRRSETLLNDKLHFVDVGTSGGIWGLTDGYSLMVGGEKKPVNQIQPILETLAPAPTRGWGHVGPSGAGHFVKMVHNGIEYGLMQAYAEGFALLHKKEDFNLDLHQIADVWRFGSVVRSWLLDLLAEALGENPDMAGIAPYVQDSGEGRWTVFEAIDLDVAAPIITLSLFQRFSSRDETGYADRLVAAMRNKFGGHSVQPKE